MPPKKAKSAAAPPSSKLGRALPASIFILLAVLCFYLMDIPSMIANFPSPSATGYISIPNTNIKIRILEEFHTLAFLDTVFRDVTVAFAPSGFEYDDVSRWQMKNFYGDIGILYMIWLAESLREGNKAWAVRFPAIIMTLAQLGGGGVFVPVYYFCHIVFCPPARVQGPVQRRLAVNELLLMLLLVLAFHYATVWAMMFHPSLDARHYWTWFWQLWILRLPVCYYGVLGLRKIIAFPTMGAKVGYHTKVFLAIMPLVAFSAGVWIYTLLCCPHPLASVFLPQPLVQDTWLARMRRMLQFDQLFIGGSSLLWILWLFVDLKRAGLVGGATVAGCGLTAIVLWLAVGPGAAFGALWFWREMLLIGTEAVGKKTK